MDNQIINPETNKYMHIFTDEFISLLKMGYTVEELLNLPRIKSSPSLTGVDDLDYKIMSHLSINDLRTLSYINNYTYDQLHQDEFFWINKLKEEGLYESIPDIDLTKVNWLKLYKTLKTIKDVIYRTSDGFDFKYTLNKKDVKYFNNLALSLKMRELYPEFKISYSQFGPKGYYIKTEGVPVPITVNKLSALLFDLYYNNRILKI